ncbi:MAG: S4 domain-containing protein [Sandaracinaceae bacterium]|nr:S4 domain-containing protein [Sandaracinaceae bacterium]
MGLSLDVADAEDGSRLDVLLVKRVEGMSRAKARRMIEDGTVRVNGRRARKGARLASGDRVELDELPVPADFPALAAPEVPLAVRYEDAHLVVADKPAGLPAHPLRARRARDAGRSVARSIPGDGGRGLRAPRAGHPASTR